MVRCRSTVGALQNVRRLIVFCTLQRMLRQFKLQEINIFLWLPYTVHLAPLLPPLLRIVQKPWGRRPIRFRLSEGGASCRCSSHHGSCARMSPGVCLGSVFQHMRLLLYAAEGGKPAEHVRPSGRKTTSQSSLKMTSMLSQSSAHTRGRFRHRVCLRQRAQQCLGCFAHRDR